MTTAMRYFPLPAIFSDSLLAVGSGYQWSSTPPLDLMGAEVLSSENPWFVLAAVLERAKGGDHHNSAKLVEQMEIFQESFFFAAIANVLGVTSPRRFLRGLDSHFESVSWPTKLVRLDHAHRVLSHVHELWVVPALLDIYLSDRTADEIWVVSSSLSSLLEDAPGEIQEAKADDSSYRALVLERYDRLTDRLGTDEIAISRGRAADVSVIARRLLRLVVQECSLSAEGMRDRMLLEAFTGLDCRAFYREDRFQPLAAAAVLEDFLERIDFSAYRPGVRYFFGHPVPIE